MYHQLGAPAGVASADSSGLDSGSEKSSPLLEALEVRRGSVGWHGDGEMGQENSSLSPIKLLKGPPFLKT